MYHVVPQEVRCKMENMDEFESRFIKGGSSKFWKPTNKGDKVFGTIMRLKETKLGKCYVVKNEDGEEIALPSHAAIMNRFKDFGIGIGDTVLIRYDGLSDKTYFSKHINLYSISCKKADGTWVKTDTDKPTEEEPEPPADEEEPEPPKEAPPKEEPKEQPTTEVSPEKKIRKKKEAPKEESKVEAPVAEGPAKKEDEVKHFVGQLMRFYQEMPADELDKYVNQTRDFGLPMEAVCKMCDLEIFERDGKKFVKKK